jgi:phosphoenolpyruvate carboxykinase (ATP)
MKESGIKNPNSHLSEMGIHNYAHAYWNLTVSELTEHCIKKNEAILTDTGALAIKTGEFTGRSPKDKFIVKDDLTANTVNWGDINIPFEDAKFEALKSKMVAYLQNKEIYIREGFACAADKYKISIRVLAEKPWSALFAYNMFMRPNQEEFMNLSPEWTIICAPGFKAVPSLDGTRQANFAVINFSKKTVLIGGTGYTGEIKKGIFTILNYVLPHQKGVLSMHCSANLGKNGDTAIFFGLSGTGKTTLSADPERALIGDDEHGWSDEGVFNFEGGCYAKCVDLTEEKEPQIWKAIKYGSLLENIGFYENTRTVDFSNISITENTRVSYPIHYIDNALPKSEGPLPKNIFFLTADATGVLPPISKLTKGQAMYNFISGYTAKVAGTEMGITEPQSTFSACFGAAFLPLHPTKYAEMLGELMTKHNVRIWLVNTGWTGGAYGIGSRIKLSYTRALISAALNGALDQSSYETLPVFNLSMPTSCPAVPSEILNPRNTWQDKAAYDQKANELASKFIKNFDKYKDQANQEILEASPQVLMQQ